MARKIRIEDTGFHHILNRGVERRVIFDTAKDKEKFLDIVCEVSKHYDFIIHVYVLEEKEKISQFQKEASVYKTKPKKIQQKLKLKDYFKKDMSKLDRNKAILKAWQDGFMQSEIAKFLDLSDAGVSKILKKLKVKP